MFSPDEQQTDRFRHDRSAYERPTARMALRPRRKLGYALQARPDGARRLPRSGCVQTGACRRRRGNAAGRPPTAEPCANGPGPDGVCGLHRPPCAPRRTFAIWRGRLSALAIGATVALVALLALKTDLVAGRPSSLDPGPLSAAHSHFVGAGACATCHTAFGSGAERLVAGILELHGHDARSSTCQRPACRRWPAAALARPATQAAHRLSAACTECHSFGGNEQKAHNRIFEDHADLAPTDCLMCHTEHKGSASADHHAHPSAVPELPHAHHQGFRQRPPGLQRKLPLRASVSRSASITPTISASTSRIRPRPTRCRRAAASAAMSSAKRVARSGPPNSKPSAPVVMARASPTGTLCSSAGRRWRRTRFPRTT